MGMACMKGVPKKGSIVELKTNAR